MHIKDHPLGNNMALLNSGYHLVPCSKAYVATIAYHEKTWAEMKVEVAAGMGNVALPQTVKVGA